MANRDLCVSFLGIVSSFAEVPEYCFLMYNSWVCDLYMSDQLLTGIMAFFGLA